MAGDSNFTVVKEVQVLHEVPIGPGGELSFETLDSIKDNPRQRDWLRRKLESDARELRAELKITLNTLEELQ